MNKLRIGVVGLGLIGGSILKSLQNKDYELIGVSRSVETIQKVLKEGLVVEASIDFSVLSDSDIVFVCTPMNKLISTIDKVAEVVSKDCIVTDVASLKGFISEYMKTKTTVNFIGGHPMAGTEHKGFESSFKELFQGAKWVLTTNKNSKDKDIELLKKVIVDMGAKVVFTDAQSHDKAVALVSHMPMVLSQALYGMVSQYDDKSIRDLALNLASSGFRDMTRLSMSNPEMADDMIKFNKSNIEGAMSILNSYANKFLSEFDFQNDVFTQKLESMIDSRKKMYDNEGKNIY